MHDYTCFLLHMLTHIQMDRKFQLEGHLSISRLSALISQEMFPGDSFEIFQTQNIIFVPMFLAVFQTRSLHM